MPNPRPVKSESLGREPVYHVVSRWLYYAASIIVQIPHSRKICYFCNWKELVIWLGDILYGTIHVFNSEKRTFLVKYVNLAFCLYSLLEPH